MRRGHQNLDVWPRFIVESRTIESDGLEPGHRSKRTRSVGEVAQEVEWVEGVEKGVGGDVIVDEKRRLRMAVVALQILAHRQVDRHIDAQFL